MIYKQISPTTSTKDVDSIIQIKIRTLFGNEFIFDLERNITTVRDIKNRIKEQTGLYGLLCNFKLFNEPLNNSKTFTENTSLDLITNGNYAITNDEIYDLVQEWCNNDEEGKQLMIQKTINNIPLGDIKDWNVSQVTNMAWLFSCSSFNEDISQWDVSNVETMEGMFRGATSFNSDISQWDVSKVEDMSNMFDESTSFNGDICGWDVSSVHDMRHMLSGATSFNSDISQWDVSNVETMEGMFRGATSFNSDISQWDVSSVGGIYSSFSTKCLAMPM